MDIRNFCITPHQTSLPSASLGVCDRSFGAGQVALLFLDKYGNT
ncbi:MAG: hypothetical protein PHX87_03535 [Candidatus Peribacteraceae bacterium]|nr:hypothetical protein [Candidatus Peribacteraceae bacterium]MDD5742478.1 hypothetical protein [Candidatus Peribacteraceae bacterium]